MDEIISTVVANGIWAVLFCGLLVFELRDSRGREGRYTGMIAELSERLATVNAVERDAKTIKSDVSDVREKAAVIKSDTAAIRAAVAPERKLASGDAEAAACAAV